MSLFTALRTSLSGISSITSQISVVSNNISNATVKGYTEKSVTLASDPNGGVTVGAYSRATDTATFNALNSSTSEDGYYSTLAGYMDQVKSVLGITGSNSDSPELESAMTAFQTSWSALEADPTNSSLQTAAVNAGKNIVTAVNSISTGLSSLSTQVSTDIVSTCSDLNNYLQQIANLNTKIATAVTTGGNSGDLQDQRDALLLSVSKIVNINVMDRTQGQIAVYTDGGYCLLDGTNAQTFAYNGTDVYSTINTAVSLNNTLVGGSLQAAVGFRSNSTPMSTNSGINVIQKIQDQLNSFVLSLTTGTSASDFAYAYNNASGDTGESPTFFNGTSTSDFMVNSTLVDGSEKIKIEAVSPCSKALSDQTKTFSGGTLSLSSSSYTDIVTGIMSAAQTAASNIAGLSTTASDTQSYLNESYANKTGVNTNSQTVMLTTLQNAYSSMSHIIKVIETMFDDLESILS